MSIIKEKNFSALPEVKAVIDIQSLIHVHSNDPSITAMGRDLASQVYALKATCEEFVEGNRVKSVAELQTKHQSLVAQKKSIEKERLTVANECGLLDTLTRQHNETVGRLEFRLRLLKEESPNPEFALTEELERFNLKVAQHEAEVDKARREQFTHLAEKNAWGNSMGQLTGKLKQVEIDIGDVWFKLQRLKGVAQPPRFDRNTGLMF